MKTEEIQGLQKQIEKLETELKELTAGMKEELNKEEINFEHVRKLANEADLTSYHISLQKKYLETLKEEA